MQITYGFKKEFDDLMFNLRTKYGEELFNIDGIGRQLDIDHFAKNFFNTTKGGGATADVSIDANANVTQNDSIAFKAEFPKSAMKLNSYYRLWKSLYETHGLVTANNIIEAQLTGAIYVNDATDLQTPYCYNFSCMDIAMCGLPMVNKIKCHPPKYLTSFKSQVEQFLAVASNSVLGATGLADLFIVMAHYVDKALDTLSDDRFHFKSKADVWAYVESMITSLIYTLNQPMRGGLQSPFVNVSVYDSVFLEKMLEGYQFPDVGAPRKRTVQQLQKVYLDVMNRELERTPVTFPVTTACFSVNNNGDLGDLEFVRFIARKNQQWGFINIYCGKTSSLSSCCRLRSDIDEDEYHNSFGAGSTKIGSLGVCTINMPRVAWLAKSIVEADSKAGAVGVDQELYFLNVLESFVRSSALVNLAKRSLIMERIKEKALPLYDHGFMDIKTQYLTVGVNGMAEACEIMGIGVMHDGYRELMAKMIDCINNVLDALNTQYASEGIKFNVEQTPSENSAIKLATKDHYLGYNVDESGDKKWRLYSNQFIPLTHPSNLLDRITVQGMLDRKFTGGAICHLNIEQRVSDPAKLYELIRVCARKGVIYWAANYCLQECAKGHMSVGMAEFCPVCGSEIVNEYTRVVGFLTNTKHWHEVRRGKDDYTSRIFY